MILRAGLATMLMIVGFYVLGMTLIMIQGV